MLRNRHNTDLINKYVLKMEEFDFAFNKIKERESVTDINEILQSLERNQVYLMSFFRFPVIGKFSEIALWLRISRVSQPKKILQTCRENWAILSGNYEILQILSKHFILTKKSKPFSQKILQFKPGRNGFIAVKNV
jgi:hypothetical protein